MSLNANIGRQITPENKNKHKDGEYLMEEQARHIYKKVESGDIINTSTLRQEIKQDWELSRLDNTSGDINPYGELMVNNTEKIDTILLQMEQWSILGNVVKYIQYDKHPRIFTFWILALYIKKSNGNSDLGKEKRHMLDLNFGDTPEKL